MKIIASKESLSKIFLFSILSALIIVLAIAIRCVSFGKVLEAMSENNEVTVIIDAGHGGIDGGTSAKDGTIEKNLNLSIALKLRDTLEAIGIKTVMTRTDDRSIHDDGAKTIREQKVSDIKNRLKIIQTTPNCVFVSIHQNHFQSSKYYGTQVFYSKNNPESKVLADTIRKTIVNNLQKDNNRELKQSGKEIYLLYHSIAPSVMVECGFLSNENDTRLLKDEQYQKEFAFFTALGISDYINSIKER